MDDLMNKLRALWERIVARVRAFLSSRSGEDR